jgi:O-acetyl-ADP-ribose deacetylase (regulator of RNase III)
LPVSCVEQGRWREDWLSFQAGETAYPTLRRQKAAQVTAALAARGAVEADQGAVWSEVESRQQRMGTHSATGAMRDGYAQRERYLAEVTLRLPYPEDDRFGQPVGVVVMIGGQAQALDLFERPETLQEYWPRLVRSYALEADGVAPAPVNMGSARRLLRRPLRAKCAPYRSPGLGVDVRISGSGVVGAALVHAEQALHIALFRQGREDEMGGGKVVFRERIGRTSIEVIAGDLLEQEVGAVMLSANRQIKAGSGCALAVEQRAGRGYLAEMERMVRTAGPEGLARGGAAVMSGGAHRGGEIRRWVLQAITMEYRHGQRVPATPEVVYGAVRAALEKAEAFRMPSVATYLMVQRPGYGSARPEVMAEALMEALVDHAAVATSVRRIVVCETDAVKLTRAVEALQHVLRRR